MTPTVELRVAAVEDVPAFAARMRSADAAEVMASSGFTPEQALREALRVSTLARSAWVGEEPLAMFGMVDTEVGLGVPWALTTDGVDRHARLFYRSSKVIARELAIHWPVQVQAVDARYTQALSWLRRLGFKVWEPKPWGVAGLPFHVVTLGV